MANENSTDAFNLDSVDLENVTAAAERPFSLQNDAVLPGLSLALFFLIVGLSLYLGYRRRTQDDVTKGPLPRISTWPIGLRLGLVPLIAAYILTHALSAVSVYYNTKIANASTLSYFEALGPGRLSSLSHAHFFAHATMYFLLTVLVQPTGFGFFVTVVAPLVALWSGIFDVISWWGIKYVSPSFEILSALTGAAFSLSFLVMGGAILWSAFPRASQR